MVPGLCCDDDYDLVGCDRPGKEMEIVIVGIGQSLRGDDAAGLAVVQLWKDSFPLSATDPHVRIEFASCSGIDLLYMLRGAQAAILVDAVQSGVKPGTLHVIDEQDLLSFDQTIGSSHGLGVAETLAIGRILDSQDFPARIVLIGIEAEDLTYGEGLSRAVQAALPSAARLIESHLRAVRL